MCGRDWSSDVCSSDLNDNGLTRVTGNLSNLLDLLQEERYALQVHLLTVLLDSGVQHIVVWGGQLHAREQVRSDAVEKGKIVIQEFGQVDVNN